jgi:hypothetical protein
MAGGSVHIPWYATGFRGDKLEAALAEIAPVALRYGAMSYNVFRYRDDRYKFIQTATFNDKLDWSATGAARSSSASGSRRRAGTRCPWCTRGPTSSRRAPCPRLRSPAACRTR